MLKRFVLIITTIALLFAFVTYQPKKTDAFFNVAVKIMAQQTIKTITKVSVDKTVQKLLVDELLDEVKEKYAVKTGMKLVESGGQKLLVKQSFNEAEKKVLKDKIDDVIEAKVYGNSPKWVKYVDWFIGAGAIIMTADMLYHAATGDVGEFVGEIIMDALIALGWASPAVPKNADGTTPTGDDPVKFPDTPVKTYTDGESFPSSYFHKVRNSTKTTNTQMWNVFNHPLHFYFNRVVSYEAMYDTVNSSTRFPMPLYYRDLGNYVLNDFKGYLPVDLEKLHFSRTLESRLVTTPQPYGMKFNYIVHYGNARLVDNMPASNLSYKLPTEFVYTKYNKLVIQHPYWDKAANAVVSRLILISTHFGLPTLSVYAYSPMSPTFPEPVNERNYQSTQFSFQTTETYQPPSVNPINLQVGIHTSVDLALGGQQLPPPRISPNDVVNPLLNPSTGKIAIPQKTVLPDGYTYDPKDKVIKDPKGVVVQDPSTIPLPNPDPVLKPSPDGTIIVDDVPTDTPIPPGGIDPPPSENPDGGIEGGSPKDIDWDKLKAVPAIFTKKFPFSLPWDAKRFIDGVLGSVPEAKDIVVKLDKIGETHIGMNIKLPDFFDTFFSFTRVMTLIIFDIGLIFGLYRLLGGAS